MRVDEIIDLMDRVVVFIVYKYAYDIGAGFLQKDRSSQNVLMWTAKHKQPQSVNFRDQKNQRKTLPCSTRQKKQAAKISWKHVPWQTLIAKAPSLTPRGLRISSHCEDKTLEIWLGFRFMYSSSALQRGPYIVYVVFTLYRYFYPTTLPAVCPGS